ncbi:MAG: DUF1552 domain-containing protein [Verrucomicrobiota bacterium]|nr:DUF1552 domain-containing protein [Verrucomicrobiota bacterium]
MTKNWHLPRRTFLKGLGTAMALPLLEAMTPAVQAAAKSANGSAAPLRMAFVYVPNGANMEDWTPKNLGAGYDLPPILQPLQPVQEYVNVISGLTHNNGRAGADGAGDHARASATFLTGARPRKTDGADIKAGVSVDQLAAQKIGHLTRLSSLEIGCDRGQQAGNCDSGYSCAYSYNISWKTESTPLPPEVDPRLVFERLFATNRPAESAEAAARRDKFQKSVLDFAMDDAKRLKSNLGRTDQRKLDEYLTAVRELEQRIERAQKFASQQPDFQKPSGIPEDYEQHIRLMYDLMLLAFQTDTTRISTFVVAHDGSNRPYPFIGVSDGHHDLSHHGGNQEKKSKIAKINTFHSRQFAYFLERMKSVKEGSGSLLDNCMIVYGSGLADGNRHEHENLPVLLAGKAGGTVTPGRHIKYASETPMANLFLSMLDRAGVSVPRIGDSSGKLDQLAT